MITLGEGGLFIPMIVSTFAYAVRSLRKSPGFAILTVSVLALGIGCSSAIFMAVDGLLFRPLAVRDPNQLMVVGVAGAQAPDRDFPYPLFDEKGVNRAFPFSFYELFRDHSRTLSDVVAVSGWMEPRPMVASGFHATQVETINSEEVSGNYFRALGISAFRGRTLEVTDDTLASPEPAVVLAYAYWVRRFGADDTIVGKTLRLDDVTVTIVGVLPPAFKGAQVGIEPDLWYPIQLSARLDGGLPWGTSATKSTLPWINILGRLPPGISRAQATAELDALFQNRLEELDPRRKALRGENKPTNSVAHSILLERAGTGYAGLRSTHLRPVFLLMASVVLMQLIACANVGALLLSRGVSRRYEYALRSALGASRSRLISHMMAESLILAGVAGFGGLGLAALSRRFLAHYFTGMDLRLDGAVLAFGLASTFLTAVGFGLIPALQLSSPKLTNRLKDRTAGGRQRLRMGLVILQIGFAFLLLSVAGLFARTLRNVNAVDTGFQRLHRQLFDLSVPAAYSPARRATLFRNLETALSERPEVEAASSYQGLMILGDIFLAETFFVPGYNPSKGEELQAGIVLSGPGFFHTMGIPLLRGRDFDSTDGEARSARRPPIIISAWSAQKLFGSADPVGHEIWLNKAHEVVGVARDIKYAGLRETPTFVFYIPLSERTDAFRMTFAFNTKDSRQLSLAQLSEIARRVDPQAQVIGLRTIEDKLQEGMSQERLIAYTSGFFGLAAIILSSMGLFGLLSCNVTRRNREIGTRIALGSSVGGILRLVVKEGLCLCLWGCGAGLAGALVFTQLVKGFLFGIHSLDAPTLMLTVGALLSVALIACVLPAWRAARVNPITALRSE